jgi:hypothetical protein
MFILECESGCADAIAAKIIVGIRWELDLPFEGILLGNMAYSIKALRPRLTGRIRADAAFLVSRMQEAEEA